MYLKNQYNTKLYYLTLAFLFILTNSCSNYRKALKVYESQIENRHIEALKILDFTSNGNKPDRINELIQEIKDDYFNTERIKLKNKYPDSKIAYIEGQRLLYTMSVDGSKNTLILDLWKDLHMDHPRWSPDGKYITFHAIPSKDYSIREMQIFTIKNDGAELNQITTNEVKKSKGYTYSYENFNPDWSFDGKSIIYNNGNYEDSIGSILNTNITTGETKVLYYEQGDSYIDALYPIWADKNKSIIFLYDNNFKKLILGEENFTPVFNIEDKNSMSLNSLLNPNRFIKNLILSNSQKYIAFNQKEIKVLDIEKQEVKTLNYGEHPAWSPDDEYIMYSDNGEIYVNYVSADEYRLKLPIYIADGHAPAWSNSNTNLED